MGENLGEFRLRKSRQTILRNLMTLVYFVGIIIFVIAGLKSYETDATSGEKLSIPSIHLDTTTKTVDLVDRQFDVPDFSVGAYYANENKIFLMGHKATIFADLKDVAPGDEITFADAPYTINSISVKLKSEISMSDILAPASESTLVLMTCHGTPVGENDYTHRLIITATSTPNS